MFENVLYFIKHSVTHYMHRNLEMPYNDIQGHFTLCNKTLLGMTYNIQFKDGQTGYRWKCTNHQSTFSRRQEATNILEGRTT